jgi:apolipoprotein D and lipocalin family protein
MPLRQRKVRLMTAKAFDGADLLYAGPPAHLITKFLRIMGFCLLALIGIIVCGCAGAPRRPLPTVDAVDLGRYMGAWYEVALLPNNFQAACAGDTQARYELEGELVRVLNRCRAETGEVIAARGVAKTVPGSGNAKLRVSFFRPFYGDYWVLAIDPGYRWVLVGVESRKYAWILSRRPDLDETTIEALLSRAAELGFDRAAFQRTRHSRPIE